MTFEGELVPILVSELSRLLEHEILDIRLRRSGPFTMGILGNVPDLEASGPKSARSARY